MFLLAVRVLSPTAIFGKPIMAPTGLVMEARAHGRDAMRPCLSTLVGPLSFAKVTLGPAFKAQDPGPPYVLIATN